MAKKNGGGALLNSVLLDFTQKLNDARYGAGSETVTTGMVNEWFAEYRTARRIEFSPPIQAVAIKRERQDSVTHKVAKYLDLDENLIKQYLKAYDTHTNAYTISNKLKPSY